MIGTPAVSTSARKLALGTAQFGLSYGIANEGGQVAPTEVSRVLALARKAGMETIDTAVAYGNSEEVLGRLGVQGWLVVTKLPPRDAQAADVAAWVVASVEGSLARLRLPALYGLLLHQPNDLLAADGDRLCTALARLRTAGLVRKIGISVYSPADLDALLPRFPVDIVQAPFNVFDRRLQTSGWLDRLKEAGVEVHARSVFLQGLLLMPGTRRPRRFDRWERQWNTWDQWLDEAAVDPLAACLGFVLANESIDRVVVGVDSAGQLSEMLDTLQETAPLPPAALSTDDIDLIHPGRWPA